MVIFQSRFWKICSGFFLRHGIGCLVSLMVGAVVALPAFVWHFSDDFRGVEMLKANTEQHYVAQVQEVYDGDYLVRNPFFKDLKNTPYLFPPLSPVIVALFGKLFGLSAVHAVMVGRFVFVSILAFFVYLFTLQVSKKKTVALVAPVFVILGYALLDPSYALNFLRGRIDGQLFIDYGRPINPQISSLFFFGYLAVLWAFLHTERRLLMGVIMVLLLGASFYVYLFTWTYLFSLNGFLVIVYAARRDWRKVKGIIWVSVFAALAGFPYLFNTYLASQFPWYQESALRFGFIKSHAPAFSRLVAALAVLFGLGYRYLSAEVRLFFIGVFATAFFVVNEQVLTGLFIFNDHYHWYYTTPLMVVLLLILLFQAVDRLFKSATRPALALTALLLIGLFFHGGYIQYVSYRASLAELKDEQRYAPVLRWLGEHSEPQSVVFGSYPIIKMIPALTPNNVYYYGTGIYTLVSNERLLHSYLMYTYLNGVPAKGVRDYFASRREDISSFVFGYTYLFGQDSCAHCVPDRIIDIMARQYRVITPASFVPHLKQYPIDYLVWDKKSDPGWALTIGNLPLEKVAEFDEVVLYRVP